VKPVHQPLPCSRTGFTLVELIIGMTLSAMVLTAVLSSYLFLAKSFIRLANQQVLETEARRTLEYFSRDVQMASGISGTPSATSVTLILPTSSGTTTVTYAYNGSAGTFTRTGGGSTLVLVRSITASGLTIHYYDSSSNEYISYTNYLTGIKQLSLVFSTQTGASASNTQTLVHQVASGRLLIHNSSLLQ
jgi:prepilin-type N-terminal cleavage/methylation domain-containing protein